jgi:hypothetical protein
MAYADLLRIDFRSVGDTAAMAPAVDFHNNLLRAFNLPTQPTNLVIIATFSWPAQSNLLLGGQRSPSAEAED